jgi:hypothetical protein
MRWLPWALGIAGVLQYAIIAAIQPSDYVGVDMAYLVMWLAIIGGVLTCYLSCWGGCGYGGYGGCGCCDDGCQCGDCGECGPGDQPMTGHEGHDHGPGHHH